MTKMIIRAKTFEGWMKANLKDYLPDIASHGADSGYPGITYYADTVHLYDKFSDEIWDMANVDAEEFGYRTTLEFIASFNIARCVVDDDTFKNLMVWYAAERIARELTDQ